MPLWTAIDDSRSSLLQTRMLLWTLHVHFANVRGVVNRDIQSDRQISKSNWMRVNALADGGETICIFGWPFRLFRVIRRYG